MVEQGSCWRVPRVPIVSQTKKPKLWDSIAYDESNPAHREERLIAMNYLRGKLALDVLVWSQDGREYWQERKTQGLPLSDKYRYRPMRFRIKESENVTCKYVTP